MGNILGQRGWEQSNGGLWLPRAYGMPETVYGWCCCEEGGLECECDCDNCAPIKGEYVKNAPCCWKVVISGIAAHDPLQCPSCSDFNRTYYLAQKTWGESPDNCTWLSPIICPKCEPQWITLQVLGDGDAYKIRVTLGAHVWEKSYASPPPCCGMTNEELEHTTNSGDCDSSEATCVISATPTDDCAAEPFCWGCSEPFPPPYLSMEIGGIADAPCNDRPCGCYNTEVLNGTYLLRASCWPGWCYYSTGILYMNPCNPDCASGDAHGWVEVVISWTTIEVKWYMTESTSGEACFCWPGFKRTGGDSWKCFEFDGLDVPVSPRVPADTCDLTNAYCKLTAITSP